VSEKREKREREGVEEKIIEICLTPYNYENLQRRGEG
jgi:hypothetical protein